MNRQPDLWIGLPLNIHCATALQHMKEVHTGLDHSHLRDEVSAIIDADWFPLIRLRVHPILGWGVERWVASACERNALFMLTI